MVLGLRKDVIGECPFVWTSDFKFGKIKKLGAVILLVCMSLFYFGKCNSPLGPHCLLLDLRKMSLVQGTFIWTRDVWKNQKTWHCDFACVHVAILRWQIKFSFGPPLPFSTNRFSAKMVFSPATMMMPPLSLSLSLSVSLSNKSTSSSSSRQPLAGRPLLWALCASTDQGPCCDDIWRGPLPLGFYMLLLFC